MKYSYIVIGNSSWSRKKQPLNKYWHEIENWINIQELNAVLCFDISSSNCTIRLLYLYSCIMGKYRKEGNEIRIGKVILHWKLEKVCSANNYTNIFFNMHQESPRELNFVWVCLSVDWLLKNIITQTDNEVKKSLHDSSKIKRHLWSV